MTRKQMFAQRLSEAASARNLTPRQMSEETGIEYKRLCRWLSQGIIRPTNKTAGDLETLRQYFGLESVGQLWKGSTESERYGDKVRRLLDAPLPAQERQTLCQHIDLLWSAYEIMQRLWPILAAAKGAAWEGRPSEERFVFLLERLRKGMSPDEFVERVEKWLESGG